MAFSHQGQAIQLSVTPYEAAKVKERKGYVYKNCFAWSHLRGLYSNCCKNCKNLDFLFYVWKHQIKWNKKRKERERQTDLLDLEHHSVYSLCLASPGSWIQAPAIRSFCYLRRPDWAGYVAHAFNSSTSSAEAGGSLCELEASLVYTASSRMDSQSYIIDSISKAKALLRSKSKQ